ncbi:MAG: hypothetical protein R3266_04755, partial [Gemmatimonadota bacterium]|nr:hypothetical protein [Gemmatimonadota bacterium]
MSARDVQADWGRIEDLFHRTLGLPADQASAVLDAECADDPHLREQVESLLESAGPAEGFLDSLAEGVFSSDPGEVAPANEALQEIFDPLVGTKVKRYELLEPLGGGMSRVYRGFDPLLRRPVALKFLPPTEPGSEAHKRFFVEARATAALEHENICNIHEIDETEEGRPFI